MRIEIDFQSPRGDGALYRRFLIAFPLILLVLAFWFWSEPILETLSPFALAFILAYLFNPVIDLIAGENRTRMRLHRGLAILLLYLAGVVVVIGVISTLVPAVLRESTQFARKVQRDYLPALSERVQPHFEEWFSPQLFVRNGRFTEWEHNTLVHWEVSPSAAIEPVDGETGGVRITSATGGGWALRQSVSGLVGEETYTLQLHAQPPKEAGAQWGARLSVWSSTPEIET